MKTYTMKLSDLVLDIGNGLGEDVTLIHKRADGLWEFYLTNMCGELIEASSFLVVFKPEAYHVIMLEKEFIPYLDEPFDSLQHYEEHCHVKIGERLDEKLFISIMAEATGNTVSEFLNNRNYYCNGFTWCELYPCVIDKQGDIHVLGFGYDWQAVVKDTVVEVTEPDEDEEDDFETIFDMFFKKEARNENQDAHSMNKEAHDKKTYARKLSSVALEVGNGDTDVVTVFHKREDGLWEFFLSPLGEEPIEATSYRVVFKPEAYRVISPKNENIPFLDKPFNSLRHYEEHCHVKIGERVDEKLFISLMAEATGNTVNEFLNNRDLYCSGFFWNVFYPKVIDKQGDIHVQVFESDWQIIVKDTVVEITQLYDEEEDDFDNIFDKFLK